LLRALTCYDTLRRTQQAARALAWTADEAADGLRRLAGEDAALPTAEGMLENRAPFDPAWASRITP
jgi:hypothetical protein